MAPKISKKRAGKRIALFNHKGGVGKTTLTVNVALALAETGSTVLLIDSDPQCNLSTYLLDEDTVDRQLDASSTKDGRTVWSALKPVAEGDGNVKLVSPFEPKNNLLVVPGDIALSEFETLLSEAWGDCFQRRVRGFRNVAALSSLVDRLVAEYDVDFVFYDSGPNIGGLNRSIILDCDYLVIPAACDLFSVRALRTLGNALFQWIRDWKTLVMIAPDDVPLLGGRPHLGLYLPQRFKTYGGELASNYSRMAARLERHVETDVLATIRTLDSSLVAAAPRRVGQIKEFASLVQGAQRERVALWHTTAGMASQRAEARDAFYEIAASLRAVP